MNPAPPVTREVSINGRTTEAQRTQRRHKGGNRRNKGEVGARAGGRPSFVRFLSSLCLLLGALGASVVRSILPTGIVSAARRAGCGRWGPPGRRASPRSGR